MATKPTPRHQSTLAPPPADLTKSDLHTLAVGPGTKYETLFRAHKLTRNNELCDARYYSSSSSLHKDDGEDTGGRFDLAKPFGTCNTASSESTALREHMGNRITKGDPIAAKELWAIMVTTLSPQEKLILADVSKPGLGFIPGDISGPLPGDAGYHVTQQWAEALKKLGFDGIIARSRHNNGYTIYIFGDAGAHTDLFKIVKTRPAIYVYEEMRLREKLPPIINLPEDMDSSLVEM